MARTSTRSAANPVAPAPAAERRDTGKREEIKQAAKELFARQGFVATTIRQIAAAVAIEGGSLYYHFSGKHEILATLLEEGNRRLLDAGADSLERAADDPVAALRDLFRGHVRILAQDPDQFLVVTRELQQLTGRQRDEIVGQRDAYEGILQRLISMGIEAGALRPCNVKIASYGILGCLNSVAFWFKPGGPSTIDEIADEFAGNILLGLTARSEER